MSWIGGEFVLIDVTKKDLDAAADRIRYARSIPYNSIIKFIKMN